MTDEYKIYAQARGLPHDAALVRRAMAEPWDTLPDFKRAELDAYLEEGRFIHLCGKGYVNGQYTCVWKNTPDDPSQAVVLELNQYGGDGKLYFARGRLDPVVVHVGGHFTAVCADDRMVISTRPNTRFRTITPICASPQGVGAYAFDIASKLAA